MKTDQTPAVGIHDLIIEFGEQTVNYRELSYVDEYLERHGIPDDEELWQWGSFHRAQGSFSDQALRACERVWQAISKRSIDIDAILICAPCRHPLPELVNAVDQQTWGRTESGSSVTRCVEGFDCVNMIQAVSQAKQWISDNEQIESVLVVAVERAESEERRFRKFSLFSDSSAAFVVTGNRELWQYEVRDVNVVEDSETRENTDGILMRDLDTECMQSVLNRQDLSIADIESVLYLNLYEPIAEMKLKTMGISNSQMRTGGSKLNGHCFGIDPFISLVSEQSGLEDQALCLLMSSSKTHSGALLLRKVDNA